MYSNAGGARLSEKCSRVFARVRRDAAQFAFLIEMPSIVQLRHVAEVNAGDGANPSPLESFHRRRHELAGWREKNGRIHFGGKIAEIGARSCRAHLFSLADVILAASYDLNFVTAMKRELKDDPGRAAEPDEKQSPFLRDSRTLERAIPDQAAAEQR